MHWELTTNRVLVCAPNILRGKDKRVRKLSWPYWVFDNNIECIIYRNDSVNQFNALDNRNHTKHGSWYRHRLRFISMSYRLGNVVQFYCCWCSDNLWRQMIMRIILKIFSGKENGTRTSCWSWEDYYGTSLNWDLKAMTNMVLSVIDRGVLRIMDQFNFWVLGSKWLKIIRSYCPYINVKVFKFAQQNTTLYSVDWEFNEMSLPY